MKRKTQQTIADKSFALNPSLKVIFCGEDEILVMHGLRSSFNQTISDEGRTHLLGRVLRRMTSPTSLAGLCEEGVIDEDELKDAEDLVSALVAQGILTHPAECPAVSYLNAAFGDGEHLSEASVGIIGAGYLGSRVAEEFARLGVGFVRIMDDRRVDNEDIDRSQFNFPSAQIEKGRPYVGCLSACLSNSGYDNVETFDESYNNKDALEDFFHCSDFVIAAAEVFSSHFFHTVDITAISIEKPWLSVFIDGSEACVGPIYVSGETCCYNEFEIQMEATLSVQQREYYTYKEEMNKIGLYSNHYVFPPYLNIAAGFVVGGVSSFMLSGISYLIGRCLRINFEKPYVDYEEVIKLPRSPASADLRNGYRQTFM
ncbi:MAG: ThiF family adenylyltransferase [Gemmatimonadota bacterium]|nr:ThiF family adenylyltransferase [Gemmatimonadota bacterium]